MNKKVANINIKIKDLFNKWLDITASFHKLTPQPKEILALLLYYHYQYKKEITNDKILWKIVFDYDTKMKIKEEMGIKDQAIQNALTLLRNKNIIVNNKISEGFIPTFSKDSNTFQIIFNFNIIDE